MEPLEKIDRALKILAIPAAYVIGWILNLIFPFMNRFPWLPVRLFAGSLVLIVILSVRRVLRARRTATDLLSFLPVDDAIAASLLPKTKEEILDLGVKTPLDFCYVMAVRSHARKKNRIGIKRRRYLSSPWQYGQKTKIFTELYGREPAEARSEDWILSSVAELYLLRGKTSPAPDLKELRRSVSPEVLARVNCTRDWERKLSRSIEAYGKILVSKQK